MHDTSANMTHQQERPDNNSLEGSAPMDGFHIECIPPALAFPAMPQLSPARLS